MKKNDKKKYILFPKLEIKHFLFLFFFFISFLKKSVQTYFEQNQRLAIDFLKLYMYDIGDFISIIPHCIMKKRIRAKSFSNDNVILDNDKIVNDDVNENLNINNNIKFIHNDPADSINNFGTIVKIFLFTIVDFIAQISGIIFYVIKEGENLEVKLVNLNSSLIFSIISIILFSKIMLHSNFYRHHTFSFSIDILCLIVLTVIDIIQIKKENGNNLAIPIVYLIVKTVSISLYSLENVLAKLMFLYDFISPYSLLLYKSIIHFFYLVIFSIFFIFIKFKDKDGDKKTIFSMILNIFEDKKYIIIVIGYTINSFFYNILDLQIINVFSPNHFVIARVFENFGIFVINLIFNGVESEQYLALKIIMYILLILASFIFNEFLVINICGMAKNTKLFLDYEAELEMNNKISDESSNSSSSNNNISLVNESDIFVYN